VGLDTKALKKIFRKRREAKRLFRTSAALFNPKPACRVNVTPRSGNVEPQDPRKASVITLWNGQRFFFLIRGEPVGLESLKTTFARSPQTSRVRTRRRTPIIEDRSGPPLNQDFALRSGKNPSSIPASEKTRHRPDPGCNERSARSQWSPTPARFLGDVKASNVVVNRLQLLTQKSSSAPTRSWWSMFRTCQQNDGIGTPPVSRRRVRRGFRSETTHPRLVEDGSALGHSSRGSRLNHDVCGDRQRIVRHIAHECFAWDGNGFVCSPARHDQSYLGNPWPRPSCNMV